MYPIIEKALSYIGQQFAYAGGFYSVFKDGKTVLREVFGPADLETGRPVTENSIFDIASETKCMTTTIVSLLCDEGILDWDAPVRRYLPEFHFGDDEYVSANLTLKDLACHRSGVCSNNFIRRTPSSEFPTRKDFVERISMNLTMAAPFRDKFMYCNETYVLLGYICERVTGKSWEDLVLERIAEPLGMDIAFRGLGDRGFTDIAMPHSVNGKNICKVARNQFWLNNPCGGVRTNLRGIEKWMQMWASGGLRPDGTPFISQEMYRKMITPITFWSNATPPDACRTYGLGLAPSIFRGERMVFHGGTINGFRSAMGFFPEKNCGYVVSVNCNTHPLIHTLKYILADICLGTVQDDYANITDRMVQISLNPAFKKVVLPDPAAIPQEEKEKLLGTYYNKAYGEIEFADGGENRIRIRYHSADDTIVCRGILPETGEYLFQDHIPSFGPYITDLRFAPDGQFSKFSVCDFYTPTPFQKIR